jgi:hypothetical protein
MEILNLQREGIIHEYNIDVPTLNINVKPPSKPEINLAIRQMENGKVGGIVCEILKADITLSTDILFPLFQDVWEQEKFPLDWKEGIIVKVPKKGDLGDCNNWRGVNLLNIISKVFYRIIPNHVATIIDLKLRPEQAGFRPNRSCVDQINYLRIIIEQAVEWQSPLYLTFIDYEKAFDSVDRECIWIALREIGFPVKIVNIIKEGYNMFNCRVLHDGQMSPPSDTVSGVRQGCLLSPLLFLEVMDKVMRAVTVGSVRGITWKLTQTLEF